MDILDDFISTVDAMLDSRRKRHITGGILLSAALLFGGLAIAVRRSRHYCCYNSN